MRGLLLFVGLLGIEPSLHAPEACVLPVYYSPSGVESDNLIIRFLRNEGCKRLRLQPESLMQYPSNIYEMGHLVNNERQ